jgi:hypothetical protein
VPERLENALVRELEIAYSSGAPIVKHASPYQWGNACHDLWEAGRIDLVDYAVRHLHLIYPDLTYLTSLLALLDALPRQMPPAVAFCDDPAAEIQIIRRPNCQDVLFCFCAQNGTLGVPLNFAHQWVGRCPASLVYIKDFRHLCGGCGYPTLGPDRVSAVAAFRRIADELHANRIYTLGVSLGGYAALYYGLELKAAAVLTFAGAINLTPDFVESLGPIAKYYLTLRKLAPDYTKNLRDSFGTAAHAPRLTIAYSARYPYDRRQAEQMAGLENVELVAVDYAQHNVVDPLIREHRFLPLLQRFFANNRGSSGHL